MATDSSRIQKFHGLHDNLLKVPDGMEGEQYAINFSALESATIQVVIEDPGIRWPPMDPPKGELMPGSFPDYVNFRPLLLNNGEAKPFSYAKDYIGAPRGP